MCQAANVGYHCLNSDEAQIRLLDMTLAFKQRWDWCRLLPWVPQTTAYDESEKL
jgi:hypothetical protein